jgi:hypothetical protein
VRALLSGGTLQGQVEIAAFYGGLMAVLIGWMILDRQADAKPPKDGPEADYHDPRPNAP